MAPYHTSSTARHAAHDSNFEVMMRYDYYLISENEHEEVRDAYKWQIQQIVNAADYYGFAKKKIYEFSLSSFVLITDRLHETVAKGQNDFEAMSESFRNFLQVLFDDNMIDLNLMTALMADPDYNLSELYTNVYS